jgi:hypothetical protein
VYLGSMVLTRFHFTSIRSVVRPRCETDNRAGILIAEFDVQSTFEGDRLHQVIFTFCSLLIHVLLQGWLRCT